MGEETGVGEISFVGRVPNRDLTDLLGILVLCRSAAAKDLLPRRALIPPVLLTGEFAGVLVGEVVLELLGGCLRGHGLRRGYRVGRVSSRFLRPSLKSLSCHSSMRAIRRGNG